MFDIKFLKKSGFFTEITLEKGEILFDEGSFDNNLYILQSGGISVGKYSSIEKNELKELAIIEKGDFLGEGSLGKYGPKEVKATAIKKTKLLSIDGKKGFKEFVEGYKEQAHEIMVYITSVTNRRLLDSNKYNISLYHINKLIRELTHISFKEIFNIFDEINTVIGCEFLLFLENNPVMHNYLNVKYDSRKPGKMQDHIVEKGHYSLEDIGIPNGYKVLTKQISIGNEGLGYLIVGAKEAFGSNDKRIFLGIINSLAGVLKQKRMLEEEQNKEFSRR